MDVGAWAMSRENTFRSKRSCSVLINHAFPQTSMSTCGSVWENIGFDTTVKCKITVFIYHVECYKMTTLKWQCKSGYCWNEKEKDFFIIIIIIVVSGSPKNSGSSKSELKLWGRYLPQAPFSKSFDYSKCMRVCFGGNTEGMSCIWLIFELWNGQLKQTKCLGPINKYKL